MRTINTYTTYYNTTTTQHTHVLAVVGVEHGHGGASRDDCLQVAPAASDASAVALQQLPQRDGHLLLHHDRVVHVACGSSVCSVGSSVVSVSKVSSVVDSAVLAE